MTDFLGPPRTSVMPLMVDCTYGLSVNNCFQLNSGFYLFFSGQTPAEAELNFLEVAKRTPRYGVDIHYAKVIKLSSETLFFHCC